MVVSFQSLKLLYNIILIVTQGAYVSYRLPVTVMALTRHMVPETDGLK